MKNRICVFTFLMIMTILGLQTRAQWSQKTHHSGFARYDFAGFSANGKGYMGGGRYAGPFNAISEWQEFDPVTDVWNVITPMPYPFTGLAAFGIGGYGYVSCGVNDAFFNYETYKYNQAGNNWGIVTNMLYPRLYASTATVGSKGYIIGGYGFAAEPMNDIWEYNSLIDIWTEKTALPFEAARYYATAFSVGSDVFVFGGTNYDGYLNDLWKFDTNLDQWFQMTSMPAEARFQSNSFVIADTAYVVGGVTISGTNLKEVWQYQASSDTWSQLPDFPGTTGPFGGVSFVIDEKGYIVTGNGTKECWVFDPYWAVNVSEKESSLNLSLYPNPVINESVVTIPANGSKSFVVEITNSYGRLVKTMKTSGNRLTVDRDEFTCGVYFLRVQDEFLRTGALKFIVL
jgi:N-acetylneuraminic acid mutarotase